MVDNGVLQVSLVQPRGSLRLLPGNMVAWEEGGGFNKSQSHDPPHSHPPTPTKVIHHYYRESTQEYHLPMPGQRSVTKTSLQMDCYRFLEISNKFSFQMDFFCYL